jgi:hypothetical protein
MPTQRFCKLPCGRARLGRIRLPAGKVVGPIEDQWNARAARAQPDEVRQLLTLLCEQLHDRLQPDGTPPRTVINLTAGQWHEVTKR